MQLLVSVRSAEEAAAALVGGASLIDVKEPRRGPPWLCRRGGGAGGAAQSCRAPAVSAALGELPQRGAELPSFVTAVAFVKWGLAGRRGGNWQADFLWSAAVSAALGYGLSFPGTGKSKKKESGGDRRTSKSEQAVLVAYADAERAARRRLTRCLTSPAAALASTPQHVLLLDTFDKRPTQDHAARRPTLLDWLSVTRVVESASVLRTAGVRVALAGSLGPRKSRSCCRPGRTGSRCTALPARATTGSNRSAQSAFAAWWICSLPLSSHESGGAVLLPRPIALSIFKAFFSG